LNKTRTYKIHIKGLVQGVGFRPFIYRIAVEKGLFGSVWNCNNGVFILINTNSKVLKGFLDKIKEDAPLASEISSIEFSVHKFKNFSSFQIKQSKSISDEVTELSPDIAVCQDCIDDIKNQAHRLNYPFTNCTNCGPRFSIVKQIPYDRNNTTMCVFMMCHQCRKEYVDVLDRRFHAQPIACNNCGPVYSLHYQNAIKHKFPEILRIIVDLVNQGEIIAIKGIGGFHLMCDAYNHFAVSKLRRVKIREGKSFAVMCRDIEAVKSLSYVNETEIDILNSWKRPIVIIKSKNKLAEQVQNGLNTIGIMLPYMPIHYLLFEKFLTNALVLTSGNFCDNPIIISNQEAIEKFLPEISAVVCYNRDIENRSDDSVVQLVYDKPSLIRRSRGYVPKPLNLNFNADGVFASGAELVNTFAIGKQNSAVLSQYIGDLKNIETYNFYEESYSRFSDLFRFKPQKIACDLHPDYLSSKFAKKLAEKNHLELIKIQHHHAHIASVLAEYQIDEKVIGVCFDGVGLGTDGNIWGGEFMITDYSGFERMFYFAPIRMAGYDTLSNQPWRSALSYLIATGNEAYIPEFVSKLDPGKFEKIQLYIQLIKKNINCIYYTSAGRLFDAVSALCGTCLEAGFHAEAPMRLESIIDESVNEAYRFEKDQKVIDFSVMFETMIADLMRKVETSIIAAKFHNTIVSLINDVSEDLRQKYSINKVVLSGGTFQNRFLAEKSIKLLIGKGFDVYFPTEVPVNDGGISLGQLAIAAKRL
jgi:hydrogenase maturation protein HypF